MSSAVVFGVSGALLVLNIATLLRLRSDLPVGDMEVLVHLMIDVVLWTILMALCGGPTNPLVSLYLLPLVIAAVTLPRALIWSVTLLTIGCYTYLCRQLFPPGHPMHGVSFETHLLGMWATFVFSALLIAFFLERMANAIRERDRLLAQAREEGLRNERIVALGTMAAGAAHELGTPLTTIAVITKELENSCAKRPTLVADLRALRTQVDHCKQIISGLLASAGQARAEGGERQPLDKFLDEIVAKWQMVRPAVACAYVRRGVTPIPAIVAEQTVSQAIMNLLNNAADASPDHVEVDGEWNEERLRLEIRDRGPGLSRSVELRAGEPFFSTKPPGQGIGIGLFLANATVERLGGKVGIFNREGGGACTLVEIPLGPLRAEMTA